MSLIEFLTLHLKQEFLLRQFPAKQLGQVVDFPATLMEASVRLLTAVLTLWRMNGRLATFLALMSRGQLSECSQFEATID